jgi:hypothetical protein
MHRAERMLGERKTTNVYPGSVARKYETLLSRSAVPFYAHFDKRKKIPESRNTSDVTMIITLLANPKSGS